MTTECSEIQVVQCRWQERSQDLARIRATVFIVEQGVPETLEWDGEDDTAWHFLALADGEPVGAARLLPTGQIGRMSVLKAFRRQSIGRRLLLQAEQTAAENNIDSVFLHAQIYIRQFYEQQGYQPRGEIFMDAGIAHIEMHKSSLPHS